MGAWVCRPRLHRLSGPQGVIQLEPKVLQVLLCLAAEPRRLWTRAELLDAVWDGGAVSEQVLSRAISELRKAFGDDPRAPRAIETIAKGGYRLLLPVGPVGREPEGAERSESGAAVEPVAAPPRRRSPLILAVLAVAAVGGAWWAGRQSRPEADAGPAVPLRASLLLDADARLDLDEQRSMALSPDGRTLVYTTTKGGRPDLYLRRLDRSESEPLIGGERGYGPFFSPDGRQIGFYSDGTLKRVSAEGGEAVTLSTDASDALGATWGADGTLVFTRRWLEGLWRITPGQSPQRLTELEAEAGERSHLWPELLPDGRHLLFTVWRGGGIDSCDVVLLDLETGERRMLLPGAADARFVAPRFLVFMASGSLSWAEFDPRRLEVVAPVRPLLESVRYHPVSGAGHFAASRSGVLVWADAASASARLGLYRAEAGGWGAPVFEPGEFATPQLSPRGSRLAVTRQTGRLQIWLHDLERGSEERLTGEGESLWPVWSPDGRSIAFSSQRDGVFNLYRQEARGDAPAERLTTAENLQFPGSWSPDGRRIAYAEFHPERRWDIWLLSLDGDRTPVPFLQSPFDEFRPTFSPDGSLLAYVSNESGRWDERGRWEVFVRPLGQPAFRVQASTGGGGDPVWSPDGRRLYFRQGERLMSVAVEPLPELAVGEPRLELAGLRFPELSDMMPTYVLEPGGGVLALRLAEPSRPVELQVQVGGLPWKQGLGHGSPAPL